MDMSQLPGPTTFQVPDWDLMYRQGTPPWETGRPTKELIRLLSEGLLKPGPVLEIGCGTGSDAICLAKRGFEVTAVDSSPTALERARTRAERHDALLRLVLEDIFEFAPHAGSFDLVYEAGFYHFIRRVDLSRYLDMLWHLTRPGSFYLSLVGSDEEQADGGPPAVSRDEIHYELGRLFEFVQVRPCRFESSCREEGYAGWSCLMRRPAVG
jgi:methyl halide transferase